MTTDTESQQPESSSSSSPDTSKTSPSKMPGPNFKIDPSRASTLLQNIAGINSRISQTCKAQNVNNLPRLVAVSKLKPATDIAALHSSPSEEILSLLSDEGVSTPPEPQVHFGENYVQELVTKSHLLPQSIKWHFIGGLQSNKCLQLARDVRNLWAVESVDTEKKARELEKGRKQRNEAMKEKNLTDEEKQLRVFVQLNTSGEDSKAGLEPKSDGLVKLCRSIINDCPNLKLQGLMTIGAIARSQATTAETENEDFVALRESRNWIAEKLDVKKEDLELSMGMSEDFEGAIVQGSNEVRVGSTIFGTRPPKSEAKVLEDTEEEKK